jgi:hypothetical protein
MDWCTADPKAANHAPAAALNGDTSREVVFIDAPPGRKIQLSARGSTDPDGDALSFRWRHYPEAGGQNAALEFPGESRETVDFSTPSTAGKAEYHILLEVRDNGHPSLVAYRRAVIRVSP